MVRVNAVKKGLDEFFDGTVQKGNMYDADGGVLGRAIFESKVSFVAVNAKAAAQILNMQGMDDVILEGGERITFRAYTDSTLSKVVSFHSSPEAYYIDRLSTWLIKDVEKGLAKL